MRLRSLLIAATPAQLGTVSGLLKLLLDQIGPAGLTGTVAIAVAVETGRRARTTTGTTLTSLLTQVGALIPAPPLIVHGPVDTRPAADRWATAHTGRIHDALLTAFPAPAPARNEGP